MTVVTTLTPLTKYFCATIYYIASMNDCLNRDIIIEVAGSYPIETYGWA